MRDIKFRGKRESTNEWSFGYLIEREPPFLHDIVMPIGDCSSITHSIIRGTVGQYTGLKDKNGIEIYEGDIISADEYPFFCDGDKNYVGIVEWIYSSWQFVLKCVNKDVRGISDGVNCGINDDGDDGKRFYVVGNIYDDSKLLES